MRESRVAILTIVFLALYFGGLQMYMDHFGKHVTITEQDEVRWCMNALTDIPQSSEAIKSACYEFHGFELMDRGVKPNYDKFPKIW